MGCIISNKILNICKILNKIDEEYLTELEREDISKATDIIYNINERFEKMARDNNWA